MDTQTIYKYQVHDEIGVNEIMMPDDAEVIHFAEQFGNLCVWVKVKNVNLKTLRVFVVIPTGGFIPQDCLYRKTAVMNSGEVYHLVEKIK